MLDIYKKMKARKRLIIIIKLINKDLDEKDNFDKKDSKNNILFEIIEFFYGKEPLFNSLDDEELKLFFLPFLCCL